MTIVPWSAHYYPVSMKNLHPRVRLKAIETANVNYVLPWVRVEDEREIRHAFDHAVVVRRLGPHAQALADRHFLETVVRVHRAAEGAPYTGRKPAGLDPGPAVAAADAALGRRQFAVDDVAAGREYVDAYFPYVHYVERLREAATGAAHGHHAEHDERPREGEPAAHTH